MAQLHTDVYCLSERVLVEDFEDGALVLRVADRRIFELNSTAQLILSLTDGRRTLAEIAAALAEVYPVPLEEALHDAAGLYSELSTQGIVALLRSGSCDPATDTEAL